MVDELNLNFVDGKNCENDQNNDDTNDSNGENNNFNKVEKKAMLVLGTESSGPQQQFLDHCQHVSLKMSDLGIILSLFTFINCFFFFLKILTWNVCVETGLKFEKKNVFLQNFVFLIFYKKITKRKLNSKKIQFNQKNNEKR